MQAIRSSLRARIAVASTRPFSTSPSHSIARIVLTGRLAAEPEISATSTGQDVIKYVVGTSYGPRDNRQTSWFRVASFQPEGPSRDHLMSLPKGTLVYVEGDASMRVYEDAEGKKTSSLNIVQRTLEVLKRPYSGNEADNEGTQ